LSEALRYLFAAAALLLLLIAPGCGDSAGSNTETGRSDAAQARLQRKAARLAARRDAARLRREARQAVRRRQARRRIAEARAAEERESQARAEAEAAEAVEEEEATSSCDPNYSGACLDPAASDYDCEGGSGDGPNYTGEVTVVGSDPYGLDSDADGIGCEAE
jgi:hypothetical protein